MSERHERQAPGGRLEAWLETADTWGVSFIPSDANDQGWTFTHGQDNPLPPLGFPTDFDPEALLGWGLQRVVGGAAL
jgi:hypothetical protein